MIFLCQACYQSSFCSYQNNHSKTRLQTHKACWMGLQPATTTNHSKAKNTRTDGQDRISSDKVQKIYGTQII